MPDPKDDKPPLRTYGRRKGHRLSARKQGLVDTLLPRLRIAHEKPAPSSLTDLFDPPASGLTLEIGFGAGEHLAAMAKDDPAAGFIGCDVFLNGVAALLSHIDDAELANVRIYDGDARTLLDWLPDGSLDQVFILFPDPWPKQRHHKRRLIAPDTLANLARVMKSGAALEIASDIPSYIRTSLLAMYISGAFEWQAEGSEDWRQRPAGRLETRYERKARREGRNCCYLSFRRR